MMLCRNWAGIGGMVELIGCWTGTVGIAQVASMGATAVAIGCKGVAGS